MTYKTSRFIMQAVLTFFALALIFALLVFLHPLMVAGNNIWQREELINPFAVEIGSAILIFLATCSYVNALVYLSPIQKNRYLHYNPSRKTRKMADRILYVLKDSSFWTEAAVWFLFMAVLPARPLFGPMLNVLGVTDYEKLIVLAMFPIFLLLILLAHVMAMNRWTIEKDPYEFRGANYPLAVVKNVGIRLLAFLAIAFGGPMLLGVIWMFWAALVAVATDVGAMILVGILLFFLCSFRLLRGIHRRRIFLHNLKAVCRECHFTCRTERIFRSLAFAHPGPNVWVDTGEKKYEIKLLCSLNRYNAIYLEDGGEAQIIHRLWLFKMELLRYTVAVDYVWETDADRILIALPVPLNVYAKAGNVDRPLDVGDRIGTYRFFTGTAFLKTLERNLIERDSWN